MWREQKLPRPVYEVLPFAYIAIGCWVSIEAENFIGISAGGLLIMAGIMVFAWRKALGRVVRPKNQ